MSNKLTRNVLQLRNVQGMLRILFSNLNNFLCETVILLNFTYCVTSACALHALSNPQTQEFYQEGASPLSASCCSIVSRIVLTNWFGVIHSTRMVKLFSGNKYSRKITRNRWLVAQSPALLHLDGLEDL